MPLPSTFSGATDGGNPPAEKIPGLPTEPDDTGAALRSWTGMSRSVN
jgi:hypothetical protein